MKTCRLVAPFLVASLASASALAQDGPRKDPQGIKGISPFWESVKKGDNAYIARDFDGAIAAFKEALKAEPQNALGHYRIGEAHLAKGDTKEAEASWVAALRYVGENKALRAKIFFVLADLRERQKSLDDAKESWAKYEQFAKANPETKTYPATPPERVKRIETWKKMLKDYASVKQRITKRLAEVDKKKKK